MNHRLKQRVKRFHVVKRLAGIVRARDTLQYVERLRAVLYRDRQMWEEALAQASGAPVLLATSLGGYQPGTRVDSVLAMALTLRRARVLAFLCDSALPACQLADAYFYPNHAAFVRHGPQRDLCKTCFPPALALYQTLGIPLHRLAHLVIAEEAARAGEVAGDLSPAEIPAFTLESVRVGEHALAGALRFFASGTLDAEPHGEAVLRAFFRAALLTTYAVTRLITREGIRCAVFHHGLYVPQGVIGEVCRHLGVRVVNWHVAYRKNCFIFSDGDTYHRTLISEPSAHWESLPTNERADRRVMEYLTSRAKGINDWIAFNRNGRDDLGQIITELGLDPGKPWIGMLTNVMWDAQLHYPNNAFPRMLDWVLQTIAYFVRRPELQLVIRIHPAEVTGLLPARHRILDEIRRAFPVLPQNVAIIPPESPISTYAVMLRCNTVLIYATKTGIELSSFGIPVIVAGEAWIRGKGFSHDAATPEEYFAILDRLPLPERMETAAVERAKKYAYHFFFRRMIPLEFVRQGRGEGFACDVDLQGLEQFLPGRSRGLDVICDGILRGTPFIYPAEEADLAAKPWLSP